MIPWYILRHYVGTHPRFATACATLLVSSLLFYNFLHVFLILWAFLGGMTLTYSCVSPSALVPNLCPVHARKKKKNSEEDELTLMKTVCTVCGFRNCPRHRPELNILAFQPWTNLNIRKTVDDALWDFFHTVVKDFVYIWYRDLSTDEEFVDELRCNFRFLASVLLRRMKKVDIPKLVRGRMLKAGMQHIDICMQAYRAAGEKGDLQTVCLEYMGSHVHCAMWSRKAELEYLRRLVEALFPYILRRQALNSSVCFTDTDDFDRETFVPVLKSMCALVRELLASSVLLPTMDSLADPDLLNNLLLVFFDKTPPPEMTHPPSDFVPFLGEFSQAKAKNQSYLRLELKDVINPESPDILYPFMQFLKSEAAVNVLQFTLACEDFNKRILNPDVSQTELSDLHRMVKKMYDDYCAPNALDRIMFDQDIVDQLRNVVEGPSEGVIKLRTTRPLFEAYEHAYNLLEKTFLPLFHQSDDYYNMLCGGRPNSSVSKHIPRFYTRLIADAMANKKREFTLAQFGKLKEGLMAPDEKALSGSDSNLALTSSLDGLDIDDDAYDDNSIHDLTAWRVTIPRIGMRSDPETPKKQYAVFIIDVRRVDIMKGDVEKDQWVVERQYKEFYVLAQKLTEFHGEFVDCQLPTKKSFGTKTADFTESKVVEFETYLQKLLGKPQLKSSELLYNFLKSETEFSTSFLPEIKLGKFVKSKLVKEKGQHLDHFLTSFSVSTEASKPKPSIQRKGSNASLHSISSASSEKLKSSMFDNNADCGFHPPPPTQEQALSVFDVEGPFDSFVFVVKEVYRCQEWIHHLLLSARILVRNSVDTYMDEYINLKLNAVTQEHRLVNLINLLKDALFNDDDPPRTDDQKKERLNQVMEEFLDFIPNILTLMMGESKISQGSQTLVQIFQQPKLNKQLSYVLLDILIQELFPELILPAEETES